MATITSVLKDKLHNRLVDVGAFLWSESFSFSSTLGDDTDVIVLMQATRAMRVGLAKLSVSATLGASCTLTLGKFDGTTFTAITGKTTAGGASTVINSGVANIDVAAGDYIAVLVDDANIASAATVTVDLIVQAN